MYSPNGIAGPRPVSEPDDASVVARRDASPILKYLPVALGAVVVVVVSLAWLQVTHPFLEHDDWDAVLPVDPARRAMSFQRLLWEGRWLNYGWWLTVGHALTPVTASLLYMGSYLVFAVAVARRWAAGWVGAVVVAAVFSSPMIAELSFWPATLGLAMLIGAVAAVTLPICSTRRYRLAAWITVFTIASFLAYPPITLMLFVLLVFELIDESWPRVVGSTIIFGASYVAAGLVIFALNLHSFGVFGLQVRPWRKPNPLHGIHSLVENIGRYLRQLEALFDGASVPIILSLFALACCIATPTLRRRGIRLVLALVILFGLEGGPTLLTGVSTAYRGSGWAWLLLIVPLVWLAREYSDHRATLVRAVAVVALVVVAGVGVHQWRAANHYNQDRRTLYDTVETRLAVMTHRYPTDRVVIYGDVKDWTEPPFTQEAQYLSQLAYARYGTVITNCHPPGCAVATRPAVLQEVARGRQVIHSSRYILVVPPSHTHLHPSFS